MTTVNVTLVQPRFTATLLASPSVNVSINGSNTVTVITTETTVSVNNTNTVISIDNTGILSSLGVSTATTVRYTGNGIQTQYDLNDVLLATQYLNVSVSGLEQEINDAYTTFTVNTATSTATSFVLFTEAPPAGADVLLTYYAVRVAYDIKGDPGGTGPTGPAGPAGATGPKGDKGDKGDPGVSNVTWNTIPGRNGLTGPTDIKIGYLASAVNTGTDIVAIGSLAGQTNQGDLSIAIGPRAGQTNQGDESVAIGIWASTSTQGFGSVSIGRYAGELAQGTRAVAIGTRAGEYNQGNFSVAIGGTAGQTNQHANTIVLNATGVLPTGSFALNTDRSNAFFVKPVRRVINATQPSGFFQMLYNPTTGEIVYWTTS
jgi:hypothetical protein